VKVLVDTPVWSLALGRKTGDLRPHDNRLKAALAELIREGSVLMIGPVRQEILSGLREESQFNRLRDDLRAFKDVSLKTDDYERAAGMSNLCRSRGVSSSSVDMLICAIATRSRSSIFTTDRDYLLYSKLLPIQLFVQPK
jgi:predicted nucleic acid-binding protein